MKGLSIEEKARRYDEAKEKAKVIKGCSTNTEVVEYMDELFSELREPDDERIRKTLINGFKDYKGWDEEWFDGITVRDAISWFERQCSQIPANSAKTCKDEKVPVWSEEDKDMIRFIGNAITVTDSAEYLKSKHIGIIDAHIWLENLKNRVQPQPKQEWSEEDEKNLNEALSYIKDDALKEFIKSIRPQSQWKPSFQQMKQLEWVAEQNKDNMLGKDLMTLYKDLEKLRNE